MNYSIFADVIIGFGDSAHDKESIKILANRAYSETRVQQSLSATGLYDMPHLQKVVQSAREHQFLLKLDGNVLPEQLLAKARECFDLV